METPHTYILHLIAYVTDNSMIASMCNSNFGTQVTARRVAEIRSSIPKERTKTVEPYQDNEFARRKLNAIQGNDAFLKALEAKHAS